MHWISTIQGDVEYTYNFLGDLDLVRFKAFNCALRACKSSLKSLAIGRLNTHIVAFFVILPGQTA